MNYDCQYFITKFQRIPERKWTIGTCDDFNGKHCALGHCGGVDKDIYLTEESAALSELCNMIVQINDNYSSEISSPKKRVLAALYDILDKQIQEANVKAAKELVNESKVVIL